MDEPQLGQAVHRRTARPAPTCASCAEGTVGAGDEIEVVHRPDHGVTIGDVFVIRRAEADRLRRALDDPDVEGEMATRSVATRGSRPHASAHGERRRTEQPHAVDAS